ncbi:hypothetical protein [Kyrpidia sp.]|uniref:hypothetical protein n=1 Tax=Kyrpidia sp. TaxID=2073077 RepID=UPI00258632F4|nr:hypothetical protein [Kyrpidia sp.]MCL6575234.1 hypothetical protein [Kyrpidia sp.]
MGVTEGRSVPWYPQNNRGREAAVLPGFDEKLHHAGAGTMDGVRGAGARAGASEGLGPRFRITRVYMITGLVFLGATWALLVAAAPAIAQGAWADSFPLAAIHLFVVGYALTTVHGALLQITPVAFQGRLYSIRLGYIEYVLMVLGAVAIPLGFLCRLWMITAIGGLFVLGAFALLLWNLGCTARTLKKRGEALRSAWVFIFLLAVLILGVGMALGVPLLGRASLLLHMVAGVTGWFTTLILILSPRLIRLFVSSRHPGLERRGPELGLMAGTLLIAIGVSLVLAPGPGAGMGLWGVAGSLSVGIGWVLYLVAYGLLLFHLFQHLRYRRRRDLEWVIPWIAAGLAAGWPVTLAWGAVALGAEASGRTVGPAFMGMMLLVVFGFLGWVIAAYMAKILPFLRWMSKYGHGLAPATRRAPGERLVGVRDMMPQVPTGVALLGFAGGAVLLAAGSWSGREELAWIGAVVGVLAWLVYAGAMWAVYRR